MKNGTSTVRRQLDNAAAMPAQNWELARRFAGLPFQSSSAAERSPYIFAIAITRSTPRELPVTVP